MAKYDVDLPKLYDCIERDYRSLGPYRENLRNHASESAGAHYSDPPNAAPANPERPVNMISLYERIMMGHLVGGDPRMMVSTFNRKLRQYVSTLEDWGNRQLVKMGFGDIMRGSVRHALYLMAVAKVALIAPSEDRFGGYRKKTGEVGVQLIDFEDFVFDIRAKQFSECWYMGHRYCALLEEVQKSNLFNAKARKKLVAKDETDMNIGGDPKISTIGRGAGTTNDSYEDYVELWEIYLRKENLVVTFDADGSYEEPLLVQEWVGPPCGPFHILSYGEVIGNLVPKAPIMDLVDMHVSFNTLWMKCDNEASDAKNIVAYADVEDAAKIAKTPNGGYVGLKNPKEIGTVQIKPGPNQQTAVWATQTRDLFSRHAGNLDALGGLASQAETLGQEKLVTESASALVQSVGERTNQFGQQLMRAMAWYWWKSPYEEMSSTHSVPYAPDITAERKVTPMDRFGKPFDEMDILLDPYSVRAQTPQSKLMLIDAMMKNDILPFLPLFNQPGVSEFLQAAIKLKGRLANCPEIEQLLEKLVGVQPAPLEQEGGGESPGMPAETTRTYERVSRPGMTDQGQSQVLTQLLAGGEPPQGVGGMGLGQMSRAR